MNAGGEGREQRITTATGRKPRSPPVQTTDQLQPDLKLENGIDLIKSAWSDMKEKERELNQMRTENQYLRKTLDELHRNIIDGGRLSQRESKVLPDMQDDQLIKAVEAITKEVTRKFDETKAEAQYTVQLLEELNKYSGDEGTSISLPKPQNENAVSNEGKRGVMQQNYKKPRSEHNEQLQKNFESALSVLEKLTETNYAARLLEELNKYSKYDAILDITASLTKPPIELARAVNNDKKKEDKKRNDDKQISRHEEQLKRNFTSASSVLDKLREAEYAARLLKELDKYSGYKGTSFNLPGPPTQKALDSSKEGNKGVKKQDVEKPSSEHDEQQQNSFKTASRVLQKMTNVDYAARLLEELDKCSEYKGKQITTFSLSKPPIAQPRAGSKDKKRHIQGKNDENPNDKQLQKNFETASSVLEKLRLSEHAGLLIKTDLSDSNRPTKLAEKYSEIYDNQWKDAIENMWKSPPKSSDKDLAGHLLCMLVECYSFCEEARRKQKLALEDSLFNPPGSIQPSQKRENEDINKLLDKSLSDAVKLSGRVTSANIAQAYVKSEKTKQKYGKLLNLCDKYLRECVQLCWLMQVQTPPLRIDLKTLPGQPFDKNCYREYTKIGEKVAFVVWPALFLHENGPTLCKGIAQGQ